MKKLLMAVALLGLVSMPALAHRLDEYLQATILSIEPGSVQATMRLVPGVAVAPAVVAGIDRNRDGVLSSEEQRRYAESVLTDLQFKEDGRQLQVHLISATFPSIDLMKLGTGEIELAFSADLSAARAAIRVQVNGQNVRALIVTHVEAIGMPRPSLQGLHK
jgi:hypothetical protein